MVWMLRVHEILGERSLRAAWGLGEFQQMEREREEHSDRGTAEAKARGLEVQGMFGATNHFVWLSGGFLVGWEVPLRGGWKGKWWPHRACLLELFSENKSETGPWLQNQRTQEIIFKKETQPLG